MINQYIKIVTILDRDVCKMLKKSNTGVNLRSLVRAVFASIEGNIFRLKKIAIANARHEGILLSSEDICALDEQICTINDTGKIKTRLLQIPLISNLHLITDLVARCFGVKPLVLNKLKGGWENFNKAVKIRNRLTHPKDKIDLNVSDRDLLTVMNAYRWANSIHILLLNVFLQRNVEKLESMAGNEIGKSKASIILRRRRKVHKDALKWVDIIGSHEHISGAV